MKFTNFNTKATQTSYRHGNLYEVGSYVQNSDGAIGKVHRRGPNYVIAITEEGDMFRSWVTDIKEYKQWNTSGTKADNRLVGSPQIVKFTQEMCPGSDYDMWKKPSEVKQRINKTKPIKEEKMNTTVELSAWMLGLNVSEQREIASKVDRIIVENTTDDDLIEAIDTQFGTERMKDLAVQYIEIISEGKKKGLDGKACWKGYKLAGTKQKGGKTVDNCVKAGFEPEGDMVEYFEKDPKSGKMVKKHNCAAKVKKEGKEYLCIPEQHTMLEDGTVTHYDLISEEGEVLRNVPVTELEIVVEKMHEHAVNIKKNQEVLGEKKKLDPVGKEDGDVDNDGDKDASDSYLMKRRATVSAAIKAKKGTKKEGFSSWRDELSEKASKFVEVNPEVDDNTDPDSVFDKNKKLKGANNMKEECGTCSEKEDCGCESCLAKKASKVKRRKYQDGVNEEVDQEKKEDIVKGMKKNMGDLKARYGDKAKQVMYATANKNAKK